MKIRTGFVSNSSSTSFVIYGISMPTYKLEEWLNDHYNAMLSEENIETMEEEGNYAIVELFADLCADWLKENNLDVYTGYESEYTYIGISPQNFPGNKTVDETKTFITQVLGARFFDNTANWHEECFRDG